jgi:hypothetical protein
VVFELDAEDFRQEILKIDESLENVGEFLVLCTCGEIYRISLINAFIHQPSHCF